MTDFVCVVFYLLIFNIYWNFEMSKIEFFKIFSELKEFKNQ